MRRSRLAVFDADGVLSPSLADAIRAAGTVSVMVAAPGGGAYVGGTFTHLNGIGRNHLARVDAEGNLTDFNPDVGGIRDLAFPASEVNSLAVQGDGKILVGGSFNRIGAMVRNGIARLRADGAVDDAFAATLEGTQARAYAIATQFDRKVVVAGYFTQVSGQTRRMIARLNEDGSIDSSFEFRPLFANAMNLAYALALEPDGRWLVAGEVATDPYQTTGMVRLNGDGSLASDFALALRSSASLPAGCALALQPDGRILLGNGLVSRFSATGVEESGFDGAATYGPRAFLLQEDGRIWVGGSSDAPALAPYTARLRRLLPDGALDSATAGFVPGESDFQTVNTILATDSGQLWIGGLESGGMSLARLATRQGPLISVQPTAQTVVAGAPLSLSIATVGGEGVSYQWRRDGVAIAGASRATFSVAAAQATDAGDYTVLVSHRDGTVLSVAATVTISPAAPVFYFPPDLAAPVGFRGVLKAGSRWGLTRPVLSAGSAPLSYQWKKDDMPIPGATGPAYSLPRWEARDSGTYRVTVSNHLGAITSAPYYQSVADTPDWQWQSPLPQGNRLTNVIYQGGRYVAIGQRGTILTSPDGRSWNLRRLGSTGNVTALAYGNGRYVAIGASNSIWTSPDGFIWTVRDPGTGQDDRFVGVWANTLAYGAGRFVAVGARGLLLTSEDGSQWTARTLPSQVGFSAVAYGGGRFVAVGDDGQVLWSPDGVAWQFGPTLPAAGFSIAFGAGVYVCVVGTNDTRVFTSADGVAWTERPLPAGAMIGGVQFTDVGFLAPRLNEPIGRYLFSPDGQAWSERAIDGVQSGAAVALTHGAGRYVLVGGPPNAILHSADGVAWQSTWSGAAMNLRALASSSELLVAVGDGGLIYTSADGQAWNSRPSGTTAMLRDVARGPKAFAAVGDGGAILSSTDGAEWTVRHSPRTGTLGTVQVLSGKFYAVDTSGAILVSDDAAVWTTLATFETTLRNLAFGNGQFIAAGGAASAAIFRSTDGMSWTGQAIAGGGANARVAFGSGTFVVVTESGEIFSSSDGQAWTARANPLANGLFSSRGLASIDFVEGKFIALGTNYISYIESLDGLTWTPGQYGSSNQVFDLAAFKGQRFLVGQASTILSLPLQFVPPSLAVLPQNQTGVSGESITFGVVANGTGPLIFQWLKEGAAIAGATNATLELTHLADNDGGSYAVAIQNAGGSVLSQPFTLTVAPPSLPVLLQQPRRQTVTVGKEAVFFVVASGRPAPAFRWTKNGIAIPGATNAQLRVPNVTEADVGEYAVEISNRVGGVTSDSVELALLPIGMTAQHQILGGAYVAGGPITVRNAWSLSRAASALTWQVVLPAGWRFDSATASGALASPAAGATDLIEWRWNDIPAGNVSFDYVLISPEDEKGTRELAALVEVGSAAESIALLARPDPLRIGCTHRADTNGDLRLSLSELTRVIELYNTRGGSVRTGSYIPAFEPTEDGFQPAPGGASTPVTEMADFHSADVDHDGRLSLSELIRVIELYNFREGTARTGRYHVAAGTEDGFAPGP